MAGFSVPASRNRSTALASASRTTLPAAVRKQMGPYDKIKVVTSVTSAANTPSLVTSIYGVDALGIRYLIAAGVAQTANGVAVLTVGPEVTPLTTGAIKSVSDVLPQLIDVEMTGTPGTVTYSVTVELIP